MKGNCHSRVEQERRGGNERRRGEESTFQEHKLSLKRMNPKEVYFYNLR